ncbi:cytochrome b-c1 complex subunit Rieske, mitochondrial-like [Hyposmocoma kahamanoa]|uniref:cytochrome b-c1 complex subunit Rieske, mitochondrial-like n=1 Tax=Hyposmocoma kahamanoa TaxID=1477025 RepID=UPI000E6D948F|nr:cytochrome b-c1 complex subunit Rieske, mitochondrial-like [Hyposmocoma kahamanoa]
MNILSNSRLYPFYKTSVWNSKCHSRTSKYLKIGDPAEKRTVSKNNLSVHLFNVYCNMKVPFVLGPQWTVWTQVRFCCKPPRFHRDMHFPTFDKYRKDHLVDVRRTTWGMADSKTGMVYFLGFVGWMAGLYTLKSHGSHYIMAMAPAKDVLAMAIVEVKIDRILEGTTETVKWRGKPLFIKHRTKAEIEKERATPLSELKDPQTEEQRCVNPEWLICMAVCTHLGCVPTPNAGDFFGGFYCACHGSQFDSLGRARKGPAPTNLEVPFYKFVSPTVVSIGN